MLTFFFALVWIALNWMGYTTRLRVRAAFAREAVVFTYQLLSFIGLFLAILLLASPDGSSAAPLTAAMSLHGIYSLSFLELWSLSEGGYSLRMLDRIDRLGKLTPDADLGEWEGIGSSKKGQRLKSLARLRLVKIENERCRLTPAGRIAAAGLRTLAWIANIREEAR